MNTIFADFNARTFSGDVCLTTQGSQRDIQARGVNPGDWVWLSDGELIIGAQIRDDDDGGLVGVPAWETMVYLEPEMEFKDALAEYKQLSANHPRTREQEARILQLLTWMEPAIPAMNPAEMPFEVESTVVGKRVANGSAEMSFGLECSRFQALTALDFPELAEISLKQWVESQPSCTVTRVRSA